jgi:hypothetical protein
MNALSIRWKLRTDLQTILKACAPRGSTGGSERRLVQARVHRSKSDVRELLQGPGTSDLGECGTAEADDREVSRPAF